MRVTMLIAIIVGIVFLSINAQEPAPTGADTVKKASEPETTGLVEEPGEPSAIKPALSVKNMTFCGGVENREPVSADTTFASDIGRIFFWSDVLNEGGEASVEHVWYYNGEEKARVDLPASYPRNRIWSSKTILPEWKGEWMVVIMAGPEKLGEMTCTVK